MVLYMFFVLMCVSPTGPLGPRWVLRPRWVLLLLLLLLLMIIIIRLITIMIIIITSGWPSSSVVSDAGGARCGNPDVHLWQPTTDTNAKICQGLCLTDSRWRPYRIECTGFLSASAVKGRRARLVLGWGTAWEDLRLLSAFASSFRYPRTLLHLWKRLQPRRSQSSPVATPLRCGWGPWGGVAGPGAWRHGATPRTASHLLSSKTCISSRVLRKPSHFQPKTSQ